MVAEDVERGDGVETSHVTGCLASHGNSLAGGALSSRKAAQLCRMTTMLGARLRKAILFHEFDFNDVFFLVGNVIFMFAEEWKSEKTLCVCQLPRWG